MAQRNLVLTRRGLIASGLAAGLHSRASHSLAQSPEAASPVATPAGTPVASAASPVGRQFAWVLAALNDEAVGLTEQVAAERFNDDFLNAVPASELTVFFEQLGAMGPFVVDAYTEAADGLSAEAVLSPASGDELATTLVVDPEPPHRIAGLLFQPASTATPVPLASWNDFDRQWSGLASAVNFLAAELVGGACLSVHALHPDQRLAIGSAFKLYILGELADQVRDGQVGWDDPLAIRDEWKVAFSDNLNALAEGDERTVREFAEQMISVSDNTATDHLLFHLGRENVEASQAEMGHGEPEVNVPMLSTQELFRLKLAASDELRAAYLAAPIEERRTLLDTELGDLRIPRLAPLFWTAPLLIDEFEWFASAAELCQAMATLDAWSTEAGLEPIADILAINPGIPFDRDSWAYVGFKGGSEPGVLNLTWLLRHVDGRTFVMTGTLNDTEALIDEAAAIALLQAAAQLLGAPG